VVCLDHFLQFLLEKRVAWAALANHMPVVASPGDNQEVVHIGDVQDRAYQGKGMDNHRLHQLDPAFAQEQGDRRHLHHLRQPLEYSMEQEAFDTHLQRELEYEAWDLTH